MDGIDQLIESLRADLAAAERIKENKGTLENALVSVDTIVKAHASAVLLHTGNISAAAKILGVSRRTLHRWINQWGLKTKS